MKYIILVSALTLGACNAELLEFTRTVDEQRAAGYKWKQIPCRQVTPNVPALTLDTPGRKAVCNVLTKD